jgi:uncharacterized protein YlxW (UPF0749 family)
MSKGRRRKSTENAERADTLEVLAAVTGMTEWRGKGVEAGSSRRLPKLSG